MASGMAIDAEAILAVVAAESGLDPAAFTPEARLADLQITSIDMMTAVFELEDRFGVRIDTDAITPEFTVADFVAYVQRLAP